VGLSAGALARFLAFSEISFPFSALSAPSAALSLAFSALSAPGLFLTIELLLAALLMETPFSFPPSIVVAILLISAPFSASAGRSLSTAGTLTSFFYSICAIPANPKKSIRAIKLIFFITFIFNMEAK
jgi:hypothetical protein